MVYEKTTKTYDVDYLSEEKIIYNMEHQRHRNEKSDAFGVFESKTA